MCCITTAIRSSDYNVIFSDASKELAQHPTDASLVDKIKDALYHGANSSQLIDRDGSTDAHLFARSNCVPGLQALYQYPRMDHSALYSADFTWLNDHRHSPLLEAVLTRQYDAAAFLIGIPIVDASQPIYEASSLIAFKEAEVTQRRVGPRVQFHGAYAAQYPQPTAGTLLVQYLAEYCVNGENPPSGLIQAVMLLLELKKIDLDYRYHTRPSRSATPRKQLESIIKKPLQTLSGLRKAYHSLVLSQPVKNAH